MAPRALEENDQRALLRGVERTPSAGDRAIATVFFYGLRLSELAALKTADVSVSARRGQRRVRSGKGDADREVPLNSACRAAIDEWIIEGVEGEMNALSDLATVPPPVGCSDCLAGPSKPAGGAVGVDFRMGPGGLRSADREISCPSAGRLFSAYREYELSALRFVTG